MRDTAAERGVITFKPIEGGAQHCLRRARPLKQWTRTVLLAGAALAVAQTPVPGSIDQAWGILYGADPPASTTWVVAYQVSIKAIPGKATSRATAKSSRRMKGTEPFKTSLTSTPDF